MEQNLLLCTPDVPLGQALGEKAHGAGLKVQILDIPPNPAQLGTSLPDVYLVDMDILAELGLEYLVRIFEEFPSIRTLILADSAYGEEHLFLTLSAGARGWLFKQEPEKILGELKELLSTQHFLKPYVAQRILEEFKSLTSGEGLLPMEDEILRQCARGLRPSQVQKNLNLSKKFLRSHWENIWQKLNINTRAKAEVQAPEEPPAPMPEMVVLPETEPVRDREPAPFKGMESPSPAPRPEASEIRVEKSQPRAGAEPPQPQPEAFQLVTFRLGKEEFALDIVQLQEIQRMLPITPLPRVPAYVEGIVNLRGKIVPIVDLRKKLGLEIAPLTKDSRIVVVNVGKTIIGMIVDSVREVLRIDSGKLKPPPPLVVSVELEFIRGVVNLEDRLILLLDLNKILSVEEMEARRGAEPAPAP